MAGKRTIAGKGAIFLVWLTVTVFTSTTCAGTYSGGGNGTAEQPYRISTPEDMNKIGAHPDDWGSHFVMVNDINLADYTGTEFNIIGSYSDPFIGVFDGNGHTISNFTYTATDTDYIGLFGCVGGSAVIKDLTLVAPDVNVAGEPLYVGSLVGSLQSGTITGCGIEGGSVSGTNYTGGMLGDNLGTISNCYATADITGDKDTGGMVGRNWGMISDCHTAGSVSGESFTGGVAGHNRGGTISNCYAAITVMGDHLSGGLVGCNHTTILNSYGTGSAMGYSYTGALVGANDYGSISNSYGTANVTGDYYTGGLAGGNYGTISNCYAASNVTGDNYTGGLVGLHGTGSYIKCFWNSDINPNLNGIGNKTDPNVIGESTTNMQKKSIFTDAGWDFVGEDDNGTEYMWRLCVDGTDYPKLSWEFLLGDFLCLDGVNLIDYSFFAGRWLDDNCAGSNDCHGTDLDQSGSVDINDIKIFADNWLKGVGQ